MLIYDFDEIRSTPYSNLNVFSYTAIPHGHTFFEFAMMLAGECQSSVNGRPSRTLTVGDIIFIRPGDVHTMHPLTRDCRYRDFYVAPEKMRRVCAAFSDDFYDKITDPAFNPSYKLDITEHTLIEKKSAAFAQGPAFPPDGRRDLDYLHTAIVAQLLSLIVFDLTPEDKRVPDWLRTLFLHLSSYHYVNLSLKDIIAKSGYSHSYVCQMFKSVYGTTLLDCLNKSKAILSTNLLGREKIIDIALSLGWENPKNYSIAFKKVYGMTPRDYVKAKMSAAKNSPSAIVYPIPPNLGIKELGLDS
jgi:AraC-like DNA-binding protein